MEKRGSSLREGVVGKDAGGGAEEREQFDTPKVFTWHSRAVWSPGRVWPGS